MVLRALGPWTSAVIGASFGSGATVPRVLDDLTQFRYIATFITPLSLVTRTG